MDLRSKMPNMSFRSNTIITKPLFITSNIANFYVNLSFGIIISYAFLSNILTTVKPDISSTNSDSFLLISVLLVLIQFVLCKERY